ncbi:MAG: metal ABC transporter ATP-binding protein [Gaiellaceae bacterium]
MLTVEHLTAGYGGPPVLVDVSFDLQAGERIGVLGPNGGGKSTLFRVLLGELEPAAGRVDGPERYGFVPQTERSRLDYPVSALDVALMGTLSSRPWWRPLRRNDRALGLEALKRVGLRDEAKEQFGSLSGGQRQRVLVARALVQDAPVLLLDEPFSGVDIPSEERLLSLLGELAAEGRALLIATHDVEQASEWDRVLCLNRKAIAFGPPSVLTLEVLEQTYGGAIVTLPGHEAGILPAHHHDH